MVPTTMWSTPPSFFWMAKRHALKKASLAHPGILPEMTALQSGGGPEELTVGFCGTLDQYLAKVHGTDAV